MCNTTYSNNTAPYFNAEDQPLANLLHKMLPMAESPSKKLYSHRNANRLLKHETFRANLRQIECRHGMCVSKQSTHGSSISPFPRQTEEAMFFEITTRFSAFVHGTNFHKSSGRSIKPPPQILQTITSSLPECSHTAVNKEQFSTQNSLFAPVSKHVSASNGTTV
jgi:hypothetical protein